MLDKQLLTMINDSIGEGGAGVDYNELLEHLDILEKVNAKVHAALILTRMKRIMSTFGERETDIYVVTYPKSGTTLMQMILYQMTTDGNMDFKHLYDVSPWCRHSAFLNAEMASTGEPRIIKTHDEYAMLRDVKKGRFILVIRDCLDVISSFHEHIRDYDNPSVDFKELSERKMQDWFRYNGAWLGNEKGLELLCVHYEDLITGKEEVVRNIAAFLGMDMNEELMERILDRTSFAFMKKHESKFGEQPEHWKVYNNFIRQGKTGTGKAKFTPEQLERYQTLLSEHAPGNHEIGRYIK